MKINYKEIKPDKWLDEMITKSITSGASDIHIEPSQKALLVRFRIDGVLNEVSSLPLANLNSIISRLKVMANLDITESRRPQDAHISFSLKTTKLPTQVDLRLSIFPTIFGEAAVIRILNRQDLLFEKFENLGINPQKISKLQSVLFKSAGMILVTGPGGSGKTTTLYTILNFLKSPQRNLITLEDPVELHLDGVRQAQIQPEVGFGFANGLRSILRQDPNIVMIGEIRDDETAEIAIRAALTGILLFSTMHTTNSVGAIVRFLELGLPRSLVASALRVVIAQRLVRKICPHCKTKARPSGASLELAKIAKVHSSKLFQGKGCNFCSQTGYLGRTGIFELMFVNKEIQKLIIEGAPFTEIEAKAKEDGMQTLQEIATERALEGVTTLEEIIRIAPLD